MAGIGVFWRLAKLKRECAQIRLERCSTRDEILTLLKRKCDTKSKEKKDSQQEKP